MVGSVGSVGSVGFMSLDGCLLLDDAGLGIGVAGGGRSHLRHDHHSLADKIVIVASGNLFLLLGAAE